MTQINSPEVVIDDVRDHRYQERPTAQIRGLMIHRVGLNLKTGVTLGTNAIEICDAFTGRNPNWPDVAKATGSQNPYTFYIGGSHGDYDNNGRVWQALELNELGHHARIHSRRYIGIGLIGDFRVKSPSASQLGAALSLCTDLALMFGLTPLHVVGHGEVTGAHGGEKAPGRAAACPGDLLSMSAFRQRLSELLKLRVQRDAAWRLEDSGYRLPA